MKNDDKLKINKKRKRSHKTTTTSSGTRTKRTRNIDSADEYLDWLGKFRLLSVLVGGLVFSFYESFMKINTQDEL